MNAQFTTVGEKLRGARERRGITLQDAAKATHIKINYLQELENDHPELLHSETQARGFLRLYTSYLGLNARELMAQWEDQAHQPPSDQPETKEVKRLTDADIASEENPPEADHEKKPVQDDKLEAEAKSANSTGKRISAIGEKLTELFSKKDKQPVLQGPGVSTEEESDPLSAAAVPLESSSEIFEDIGSVMRRHRERLELSITDVEHFTNLKRMYLTAIEDGRFNELPSTVQGRGMLNNYAQFLGMEETAVMDRYAEALQRQREERMPPKQRREPAWSVRVNTPAWLRRILNPDLIVGGVLILALFGFIIWGTSKVFLGGDPEPTDAPSISEMLQKTPSTTPEQNMTLTAEAGENGEEETAVPGVAVAQPTPTVIATANAAPLQLYIITHDRAYMRIVVDGLEVFNGRVLPEEVYTYSGEVRIQLKTGNASALEVYFNQDFLGKLGDVGEVVEVDFSLEGLKTPTPQPTRTPTPDLREPDEDETTMEEG
jgi:cytoskeletal protein RodZ